MPNLAVTDTAQEIPVAGSGLLALKNVGDAGDIYIGHDDTVTTATGYKLAVGEEFAYKRAGFGGVFVISDATADLRYLFY